MNVAFLLEDTTISGCARVAMAHADALIARGHRVRIVTKGAPVTWRSSRAEWVYVDEFREYDTSEDERVYANAEELPRIVDEDLYRPGRAREHEPLRVLLFGAAQVEAHGLSDGYGAVAHARWFHQTLELVRVSPWAPSREEPLDAVQEFHVALTANEMTRLLHSCDVFLGPYRREARLALTACEALAAGLPCVFTAVPALQFATPPDYAHVAPEDNAIELGERLIEVLGDHALRERLRERGRAVAEQWRGSGLESG
jgi:hypothetical protein